MFYETMAVVPPLVLRVVRHDGPVKLGGRESLRGAEACWANRPRLASRLGCKTTRPSTSVSIIVILVHLQ